MKFNDEGKMIIEGSAKRVPLNSISGHTIGEQPMIAVFLKFRTKFSHVFISITPVMNVQR